MFWDQNLQVSTDYSYLWTVASESAWTSTCEMLISKGLKAKQKNMCFRLHASYN